MLGCSIEALRRDFFAKFGFDAAMRTDAKTKTQNQGTAAGSKAFALITGASSGIGLELARRMAREKINLILVARSRDKIQALAQELEKNEGIKAHPIAIDLTDSMAVHSIFTECKSLGFEVEFLINNAGFGSYGPFLETEWAVTQNMINLNVLALTHLTSAFAPEMKRRGRGRILNVASTAAFQPGPLMAVYFATKAFVLSFSEAVGEELRGTGVTVTALCPGATESGFHAVAKTESSRFVKGRTIPTSREVAEFGYSEMIKGTPVAIHGTMNKLVAQSIRLTPRALTTKIARTVIERV